MAKEAENKTNDFGLASVILGILSILFASAPGLLLGVIGIIFAQKQKKHFKNKWAQWGLILSIIGIILSIVVLVIAIVAASKILGQIPNA